MENPKKHPVGMTKREVWARHLDAQSLSGLTQIAYCKQHGLKIATFGY